jgi:hypothetical protein
MLIVQHFWEFLLFLIVLLAPLPLCISLFLSGESEIESFHFSHSLLVMLTCWCLTEVGISLSLGAIGQFNFNALIVAGLSVLIAGLSILLSIQRHRLQLFAQNLRLFQPRIDRLEMLVIGSVSFVSVILLERLATRPIVNYDSLWYHLPTIARWYQEGSFVRLDEFTHTGDLVTDAISYYPYNWDLLCSLFLMPFREDFLLAFPNLIAWIILGLSIYLIGIRLGAKRFYAMAGSSLVLTLPLLLSHINTLHVDLPFAAFFMVGLYFAILYDQTRSFLSLILFMASLGMLFGIKTSAIGYGALLIALLVLIGAKHSFSKKLNRQAKFSIYLFIFGLFCLFFVGGFWYLRNLIDVGNPLGIIKVQIAGIQLFPGSLDMDSLRQTSLANLFKLTNFSHVTIMGLQALVRLQLPFIAMMLQVILLLPYILFVRQKQIKKEYLIGILLLLLGTGVLYWKTPFSGTNQLIPLGSIKPYIGQQARFAFPFLSILGVGGAVVATTTKTRGSSVAIIVVISSILGVVSSSFFDIIRTETAIKAKGGWASKILDSFRTDPGEATRKLTDIVIGANILDVVLYLVIYIVVISLLYWFLFSNISRLKFLPNFHRIFGQLKKGMLASVLIGLLITASFVAREKRDLLRADFFGDIYQYLNTSIDQNDKIGYILSYRSYIFYGKDLDKKVFYTPSKSDNLSQWLDELHQKGINVVAVGPLEAKMGWQQSKELRWLDTADGVFTHIFGEEAEKDPMLYRLNEKHSLAEP